MANERQNQAYLLHLTDPHCHPILLLQKILNYSIHFNQLHSALSKHNTYQILIVTDTPTSKIDNDLVNFINSFDFPIIVKSSDYHTFVVNKTFLQKIKYHNQHEFIWKERNFQIVDNFIIDHLSSNAQEYYLKLSSEFQKNHIDKVIDAFTTYTFYQFYKKVNMNKVSIKFLVDSKFFLLNPQVILDDHVLGIKFFVDGTISSSTAWISMDKVNLFLDPKEVDEVIQIIQKNYVYLERIYLAFHCIGSQAFRFVMYSVLPKIIQVPNIILRIEHCTLMGKSEFNEIISLIQANKLNYRVYLVLNPESHEFTIDYLYRYKDFVGIGYGSDCPIFDLNLKQSIYNYIDGNLCKETKQKVIEYVFECNHRLFRKSD